MVSPAVNVVRYTALASGILYGIVHRRTLTAQEHQKQEHASLHHKEQLLEQARKAWADKNSTSASTLITDPENPKFDLEALAAAYDKH
ncbi:hypothetical protein DL93DRAFT_2069821 [Clavulina sp. PMI_390]|nr:hypothetical protein DL93DRAFT_2069821 [Clavulina sp. PMI_390]